eukprot:snap_masked-scaffold_55-processed-gene-1.6-mRNA-1 protein AED:1.00 eAED:1.00 QI:0/-1/0/0/-1/1/1/0/491
MKNQFYWALVLPIFLVFTRLAALLYTENTIIYAARALRKLRSWKTLDPLGQNRQVKVAVLECPGGTDKADDGHRKDSKYLLEGLDGVGVEAQIFQYTDETAASLLFQVGSFADAYISRVDPGEYELCTEELYFVFLENLVSTGVLPFNSPGDMLNLGSKKSLLKLAGLHYFPNSTYVYNSLGHFDAFFPKILNLHKSRVIKQNRGSKGEGVWWVSLIEDDETLQEAKQLTNSASFKFLDFPFFKSFPSFSSFQDKKQEVELEFSPNDHFLKYLLPESDFLDPTMFSVIGENSSDQERHLSDVEAAMKNTKIRIVEAKDNHEETMDLLSFRDTIVQGYLRADNDFVLDMEFLPRIKEGEVRLILSGKKVLYVVNKQVNGKSSPETTAEDGNNTSFSANLGAGAVHIWEDPSNWGHLVLPFLENIDDMLGRLKVQHPPILWTVDFIRYGDEEDDRKTHFVISEINASCVGFSANPELGKVIAEIFLETVKKLL